MKRIFNSTVQKEFSEKASKLTAALNELPPTKSKKAKATQALPSASKIFASRIFPRLTEEVNKFDRDLLDGRVSGWVIPKFIANSTQFDKISISELWEVHSQFI